MEKIQSAIAKARATRDAQVPAQVSPAANAGVTGAMRLISVDTAWQSLEAFTPSETLMKQKRIVAVGEAQEGTAQFDILRTKVLQQMRSNNWRRLAITSPTPSCGKTTTALNLAFSLARQSDLRVVLCEMDLRRPTLARTLGMKGRQNFVSVMRGELEFADQAVRIGSNLAVGVNRQTIKNTSELLQSMFVTEAISRIENLFDPSLIIFDMPPMLVSDDVMAFIGHADCALLVAAAGTTTISEIDTCERELAGQTNVMGVVMNKVRYMERDAGYDVYS